MQHDNHGDAWKWSNIEHCPLNDYAPEGKALHKIIEEMADDHDIFAKKLLDAYEKMIQNGYDSMQELLDAPINSWFGYYTMESKYILQKINYGRSVILRTHFFVTFYELNNNISGLFFNRTRQICQSFGPF